MLIQSPPGPKGNFIFGSVAEFRKNTLGFIEECKKEYGGIAKVRIVNRQFYFLTDPDLIHEVLSKNNFRYVKSFVYNGLADFLGNGLLNNEGDSWIKQRKLIQPCFHRKELEKLVDLMVGSTSEFLKKWENLDGPFEMQKEIMFLTNNIISSSVFGDEAKKKIDVLKLFDVFKVLRSQAHYKMVNPIRLPDYIPTELNRNYKKAKVYLQNTIKGLINERREKKQSNSDLLGQLINLKFEDGKGMDDQQLYDEIVTLFVAGQETTTNALSFLFYSLTQNKEVYGRIMHELDTELGNIEFPVLDDFMNLKYTNLVIKEALRLYPPAWGVSRKCIKEDKIGNYIVPKGTTVLLSILSLHKDENYWDEPERFIPERFEKKYNPKTYLPFGAGPRMCVGNHFALQEMVIAVAMILKKYELKLISSPTLDLITPITLNTREPMVFEKTNRVD